MHSAGTDVSMATVSIRGLDDQALERLKRQAQRDGTSLNGLVLRLLQGKFTGAVRAQPLPRFDDLDALAGTWSKAQTEEFQEATMAFAEVDAAHWK